MSDSIILVAETGSDVPAELARELGIALVPMHVSMGDKTLDDGAFPPEEVCSYYDKTGKVPTTSASTPYDFGVVFDKLHARYPEKKLLHLAYSAVTTCSYQNALLASQGRDYVASVDTKHVSVGQCTVVREVHRWLKANPEATLEQAADYAVQISGKVKMCFIPSNLDYLRAGGRVSNAVALVGNLLHLHPLIEIIDGKLMAGKKYRGDVKKVVPGMVREFAEKHSLSREYISFIHSPYLKEEVKLSAETTAKELGFRKIEWIKTGCVITCHGGPGAFGIVGVTE